jgi:hypothetical protein
VPFVTRIEVGFSPAGASSLKMCSFDILNGFDWLDYGKALDASIHVPLFTFRGRLR